MAGSFGITRRSMSSIGYSTEPTPASPRWDRAIAWSGRQTTLRTRLGYKSWIMKWPMRDDLSRPFPAASRSWCHWRWHWRSLLQSRRVQLGSLFIDEGFGTLDSASLRTVVSALQALELPDRQIGIISHVEGLAGQFPAEVRVVPLGSGASRVEVATPLTS